MISMVHLFSLVTTKTTWQNLLPVVITWWWELGFSPFRLPFSQSHQKPLGKHWEKGTVCVCESCKVALLLECSVMQSWWILTGKHRFLKMCGPSILWGHGEISPDEPPVVSAPAVWGSCSPHSTHHSHRVGTWSYCGATQAGKGVWMFTAIVWPFLRDLLC